MRKTWNLLLAVLLLISVASCGKAQPTWQEQYDLGVRYLSEGSYEEAIIAFTAAIEIDPKRPEAYVGLADVYIQQGDRDKAMEILRQGLEQTGGDSSLEEKLTELQSTLRMTAYDGGGAVVFRHDYTYDEQGREITAVSYDAGGNQTGYVDLAYDSAGNRIVGYQWSANTGALQKVEYSYDGAGNAVARTASLDVRRYQYDAAGHMTREDYQDEYGGLYRLFQWDSAGHITDFTDFEADSGSDISVYTNERSSSSGGVTIKTFGAAVHVADHATAVCTYDAQGRLTGRDQYNGVDELQQSLKFTYTGGVESREPREPAGLYEPGGVFFPIVEVAFQQVSQ